MRHSIFSLLAGKVRMIQVCFFKAFFSLSASDLYVDHEYDNDIR